MKVFAISDLHLSFSSDKPMDVFGGNWEHHFDKIKADWLKKVSNDDVVLIAGDISWAMSLENALIDFAAIEELPGDKVFIRGNHDYWWQSYKKICDVIPSKMHCLQNNAVKIGKYIFCGTRGWCLPENLDDVTDKKYIDREAIRLEMSLKAATELALPDDKIVVMTHYPPFNSKYDNSVYTSIIAAYPVEKVVYGHLHGSNVRVKFVVNKGKTNYYLTSCDLLKNELMQLY